MLIVACMRGVSLAAGNRMFVVFYWFKTRRSGIGSMGM